MTITYYQRPKNGKVGEHLFTCDRCGGVYEGKHKLKTWDGLIVCDQGCFEIKQPLLEPWTLPTEHPTIQDCRPRYEYTGMVCTLEMSAATVGLSTVGCLVVGRENIFRS